MGEVFSALTDSLVESVKAAAKSEEVQVAAAASAGTQGYKAATAPVSGTKPAPTSAPTAGAQPGQTPQPEPPAPAGGKAGLPDVSMGPPKSAAGQTSMDKAYEAFDRGIVKAHSTLSNPKVQDIGTQGALGGAGMLASKALAGDTSPNAPPPAPSGYDAGTAAAQAQDRERRRRQGQGRASTILTSPLGLSKPASVGAKVLLGA